ncbi:hypothetical protein Aau02nite_54760 [Amorphoplanes auranticolor]|uniref:Uncharacterized protein n=1 Tax=Actinoplanes auranticolor TaxID=47988 RepID=A0A919VR09_9ACTN|nr:hypothetical protein Aau02nite_54760 [Actinoplanes auranticolor]
MRGWSQSIPHRYITVIVHGAFRPRAYGCSRCGPGRRRGLAATSVGLHPTTVVYALVVVVLGIVALAAQRLRRA